MRRALLVLAGAAVGAVVVRQLSRAGHLDGLRREWHETTGAIRAGMAEREAELRHALGMDTGTSAGDPTSAQSAQSAQAAHDLLADPAAARAR